MTALLLVNAVILGPAFKRFKDSQILHIIQLWLDAKEGELEKRRERAEHPN